MFGIGKTKNKTQNSQAEAREHEDQLKLKQSIENNVSIHVFPKKYKTTPSAQSGNQSKVVGVIIIGLGVLVMVGMIYGGYVFLIKPSTSNQTSDKQQETSDKASDQRQETSNQEASDQRQETSDQETSNQQQETSDKSSDQGQETSDQEEEVATSTEEQIVEEEEELLLGIDSDGDGLSDREEFLLGSNPSIIDTDEDTYNDGAEVLGLYNPVGTDRLVDNSAISEYQSQSLQYLLLRPTKWILQTVGDNNSVNFAIGDGSFVNILVEPNTGGEEIVTWLEGLLSEENIDLDSIIVRDDWTGIWHKNQKIFYLTDSQKEKIFIFDYAQTQGKTLDYYTIFKMMINSFTIDN